jgi:capsular exopolysaccharide synthesis family protein
VRVPLAIVSPGEGEGKTFVTANLGIMFAQLGGRTLLIDADMRGPRLHRLFGLENNAGLSSVLAGRAEVHVIQQVAHVPGLYVLPVGILPPNPLELVERPTFTMLIREMASKFDYVLVDTPAAVRGADAAVIGSKCGAALVVARKNISRVSDLQSLVGSMTDAKTSVAGVVVNEF